MNKHYSWWATASAELYQKKITLLTETQAYDTSSFLLKVVFKSYF